MEDGLYTEAEINSAYRETFASASGRLVLRHLLRQHGLLHQCFVAGDSHGTAFNDGGRNAIVQILRRIHLKESKVEEKVIDEGVDYEA